MPPDLAKALAEVIRLALEADQRRRRACVERRQVQQRIEGLDPRERRTMELLVVGQPSKVIADDLGVSRRTVDRLRAAVYRKLGVKTALELARIVAGLQISGEPV